jgi:hypothetical protein
MKWNWRRFPRVTVKESRRRAECTCAEIGPLRVLYDHPYAFIPKKFCGQVPRMPDAPRGNV